MCVVQHVHAKVKGHLCAIGSPFPTFSGFQGVKLWLPGLENKHLSPASHLTPPSYGFSSRSEEFNLQEGEASLFDPLDLIWVPSSLSERDLLLYSFKQDKHEAVGVRKADKNRNKTLTC